MNRYFIYARKSTDEADRQVRSIDAQLNELRDLASKEGLAIVDELVESQTAKDPGRPVFNAMLDRVERGEAEGILSWHPDRLARNSIDGGRIIYLLDTGKLQALRFSIFWFEPTPQGKFMLNIAFGQSKYYVDNLSENVKRGFRDKVRRGIWPNYAPFGYLNNPKDGTIYPDPDKAPFIRKIFQLYSTGRSSLQQLADTMFDLGLQTKKRGRKLSPANLQYFLTNPIYYGLVRWAGEDYEGVHEPIVTKELFDQAQRVMAHRRNGKKKRPQKYFMFRGLFWCGECGAMFTTEQQKGHNYYRCTRKKGACYQPYVREEVLKEQVLAEVKKFLLPLDWADKMLEEIQIRYQQSAQSRESSAQALRDEIAAEDARLDKLVDAFISGDMEKDDYQRKRREFVAAKMDLKTKLEGLGRNSNFRLEPAKKLINWSKELNKSVFEGNWRALVQSLENLGSNHTIQNKTARLSVENQFAVLAEAGRCDKWRGRRDLNPRSPP